VDSQFRILEAKVAQLRGNDLIMQKLGELTAGQDAVRGDIKLLRQELFGNGQPGAVGKLFELYRQSETRISGLERWQSKALGIWVGASAAVSGLVSGLGLYFSHRGK
jgi:hypothetical protein